MNRPKLLQRDLGYEWLGDHQNHETARRYQIYVIGPLHDLFDTYHTDYVDGVREAKREALAAWRKQGLIQ